MIEIKGKTISPGTSLGYILNLDFNDNIKNKEVEKVEENQKENELLKIKVAFNRTIKYLESLISNAKKNQLDDKVGIFEAQLLLADESTQELCETLTKEEGFSALKSIENIFEKLIEKTKKKKNTYLASRATDLGDLKATLLKAVHKDLFLQEIKDNTIISIEELLPSHTMSLDLTKINGFLVDKASITSHAVIISKTLKIPLIQIDSNNRKLFENGDYVVISENLIIKNPDEDIVKKYKEVIVKEKEKEQQLKVLASKESKTLDGIKINLLANIGTEADSKIVKENQGEGVGLFRTEFLFLNNAHQPTEDEQYKSINNIIKNIYPFKVTVRTLDIGGDKEVPYLNIEKEENSFLGVRGLRLCRARDDIARPHFRAIIKQAVDNQLKIMVPMVTTLEEVLFIRKYIDELTQDLISEGFKVDKSNMQIGIMVETPSAALISDVLIENVDFFSIGSNDLTQYTLAVDRVNTKLSYMYSSLEPAVLRLIYKCSQEVNKRENKELSICGEMAGTIEGAIILIALGVKNLSMNSSNIAKIKNIVLQIDTRKMNLLRDYVLEKATSTEEVLNKIIEFRRQYGII